ncbi:hypothetical protein BKA93DRAFT_769679 [Sparassis latifolia]
MEEQALQSPPRSLRGAQSGPFVLVEASIIPIASEAVGRRSSMITTIQRSSCSWQDHDPTVSSTFIGKGITSTEIFPDTGVRLPGQAVQSPARHDRLLHASGRWRTACLQAEGGRTYVTHDSLDAAEIAGSTRNRCNKRSICHQVGTVQLCQTKFSSRRNLERKPHRNAEEDAGRSRVSRRLGLCTPTFLETQMCSTHQIDTLCLDLVTVTLETNIRVSF